MVVAIKLVVVVQVGLAAVLAVLVVDKLHTLPALETMAEMAVGVVANAILLAPAVQARGEEEQAEAASGYVALEDMVVAVEAVHMVPVVVVDMVLGGMVVMQLQVQYV